MEWRVISKLLSGSVKYLASPTSALENYHVLNIHLLLAPFPVPHVIPGPRVETVTVHLLTTEQWDYIL